MIILLSPAKTLDMQSPARTTRTTTPRFDDGTDKLVRSLKRFSAKKLGKLMHLSDNLAQLNAGRYKTLGDGPSPEHARPAIQAFRGDVYLGLDADTLSMKDIHYAQKHLRILSGLYGVLRPLDQIQAHRLEMGTRLKTRRGASLYEFWGSSITDQLNADGADVGAELVVNLASNEYFKSVDVKRLQGQLVSPVFRDEAKDGYRVIGFYAKRARGAMARYLIQERIEQADDVTSFTGLGYRYDAALSSDAQPVFTRSANVAEQLA